MLTLSPRKRYMITVAVRIDPVYRQGRIYGMELVRWNFYVRDGRADDALCLRITDRAGPHAACYCQPEHSSNINTFPRCLRNFPNHIRHCQNARDNTHSKF